MSQIKIEAELTGNVWKVLVKPGDVVAEGDTLIILESMKMEIPVLSTDDGKVVEVLVEEGGVLEEGTVAVVLEAE
jgi:biotin carboxyl carrier protein